ncbi:MAG: hypothetical protein KC561_14315 [Myxococcales bacterium]|nr:hypothetical protein [Myxococcales bacterium]
MRWTGLVLLCLAILSGCGAEADVPFVHGLTVGSGLSDPGTGDVVWQPIEADGEVPIVAGWQGGQHIWLILRADGVSPSCYVEPRFSIEAEDGSASVDLTYGGRFYEVESGYEFPAFAAFIPDPAAFHRKPSRLHVEAVSDCGTSASVDIDIVPFDSRIDLLNP